MTPNTDQLESAIDEWVETSHESLEKMLQHAMPWAQFLPLPMNAVIFGTLGKFCDGWKSGMELDMDYDGKLQFAWAEVMADPRVNALMEEAMGQAVDNKVGGMLDGEGC